MATPDRRKPLIFYMPNLRSIKPAGANDPVKGHARSKPERIADESETSPFSRFVHRNILYLKEFLTIRVISRDGRIRPMLPTVRESGHAPEKTANKVSSHFESLAGNKNRQ